MAKFQAPESHSSGFYIGKDEKAELITQATNLTAQNVEKRAGRFSDWEYVLTVELDGEERGLTFPVDSVGSRDRFLAELKNYLETDESPEPVIVKIEQAGKSHILTVVE